MARCYNQAMFLGVTKARNNDSSAASRLWGELFERESCSLKIVAMMVLQLPTIARITTANSLVQQHVRPKLVGVVS